MRSLEVQALEALLVGELAAGGLDGAQHVDRHHAGLVEPELALEDVRLLRRLPVGGLALGLGEALAVAGCLGDTETDRVGDPDPHDAADDTDPAESRRHRPTSSTVCTTRNPTPIQANVCRRRVDVMVMSVPTAATYQVP